jgi:hypothetical protein
VSRRGSPADDQGMCRPLIARATTKR